MIDVVNYASESTGKSVIASYSAIVGGEYAKMMLFFFTRGLEESRWVVFIDYKLVFSFYWSFLTVNHDNNGF